MTKKEIKEMAEYILKCLKGNNVFVFFSWGPEHFQSLKEGGLRFKVNGYLHKDWVQVVYDAGSDYFIIKLEKGGNKSKYGEIIKEVNDVDFISLQAIVDHLVETKN